MRVVAVRMKSMTYSETSATGTNDDSIVLMIDDSVVTNTRLTLIRKYELVRIENYFNGSDSMFYGLKAEIYDRNCDQSVDLWPQFVRFFESIAFLCCEWHLSLCFL